MDQATEFSSNEYLTSRWEVIITANTSRIQLKELCSMREQNLNLKPTRLI